MPPRAAELADLDQRRPRQGARAEGRCVRADDPADGLRRVGGAGGRGRPAVPRGGPGDRRGLQHPHPERSQRGLAAAAHPGAAGGQRGARAPGARGDSLPRRARGRDRRGACGAPFCDPVRVRCGVREPVPGPRQRARRGARWRPHVLGGRGGEALREGRREGAPEGDVQDGHLDLAVLPRCTDLRGGRAESRPGGPALHRDGVAHRGHRARGARARGGGASPARVRGDDGQRAVGAAGGWVSPVAAPG